MNHAEFIGLVTAYPLTYCVSLMAMLAVYIILFRKQVHAFFDPLFFVAVFTAFAASDVVFLWWLNVIDMQYFLQFIATEAAFFLGLALFRPAKDRDPVKIGGNGQKHSLVVWHGGERHLLIVLYILSASVFAMTQAITYIALGIPILYESRLKYYSVGGGIGALDRILSVTWFITFYLLLYCFAARVRIPRVVHAVVGVALVTSALLSGSKSTFTAMLFATFYFRFLRRDSAHGSFDKALAKWQKVLFVSAIIASILVLSVATVTTGPVALIGSLAIRFASFGDVYFMAYPHHVVEMVPDGHEFLAVFGNILAPFRIVSHENVPEPLGFMLHRIVFGFDDSTGPNARHNVFGLVYFGQVGSVLFSLLLGMLVGAIRNLLPAFVRTGSAVEPLYAFLAISCVWATTDVNLFTKDCVSVILVAPALYAVAAVVCVAAAGKGTRYPHERLLLE